MASGRASDAIFEFMAVETAGGTGFTNFSVPDGGLVGAGLALLGGLVEDRVAGRALAGSIHEGIGAVQAASFIGFIPLGSKFTDNAGLRSFVEGSFVAGDTHIGIVEVRTAGRTLTFGGGLVEDLGFGALDAGFVLGVPA